MHSDAIGGCSLGNVTCVTATLVKLNCLNSGVRPDLVTTLRFRKRFSQLEQSAPMALPL
jgi:hypothetical protein